jgi:aminoglycoside phosphotransferase (APT) family kinase protein
MPTISDFVTRLEDFLAEKAQGTVRILAARQLAGGASRDTWRVDADVASGPEAGKHSYVLRRDQGGTITDDALSREQEFRLLEIVYRAGVAVARPRWLCIDPAVLGAPFLVGDWLDGEAVGRRVVRDPSLAEARAKLPRQMGEQLAKIHAVGTVPHLDFLPRSEPGKSPAACALERCAQQLWRLGEPHPALELSLRWLRKNAPACAECVLLHGDFRLGNLMVGPNGLVGIFDWEFAHLGDPAEDLAWPSVRSWRFGNDHLRLAGIAAPDEFLAAYREHSGRTVDAFCLRYWEILGNLRWAVGCIAQANRHLSGQAKSIEFASLGRRTAEMELELLDLIASTP